MRRSLFYLLFIVVILFFISLRAQKGEHKILWQGPIKDISVKIKGEGKIFKRKDGSEVIVIKLEKKLPETGLVMIEMKDHIFRQLGELKGATFVRTLPRYIKAQEIIGIKILGKNTGEVLVEAQLR